MLDARLQCVAALVRDGARLADIGTDHAYLPVYLMQQGRLTSAVAADIGEGPAASARSHIAQASLTDAIDVRVCDGLTGIQAAEVSDIVIAGMGGETIVHILNAAPWVKNRALRLILQPMTKTVELRRYLFAQGFVIDEEHLVRDGRHLYCVMAAHFADAACPSAAEAPFVGALDRAEGQPYFRQQRDYLTKRIRGLRLAGQDVEADTLDKTLQALETYID